MDFFPASEATDPEKRDRLEVRIMGFFTSSDKKTDTKLKFGEVPPKPRLGHSVKQDKAIKQRSLEDWRKSRRSI